MAISEINIIQDNKIGDSNLIAVHSPVHFIVSVDYSGQAPDVMLCKVKHKSEELGTFRMIPYKDTNPTTRHFMFIADTIIRGNMGSFDDFEQSGNSFVAVPDITKEFTLIFQDPDAAVPDKETTIMACHAARQFGDTENMQDIFNNIDRSYVAAAGRAVYIYFYNDNENNIITVEDQTFVEVIAQDYDDVDFADFDGDEFLINIIE